MLEHQHVSDYGTPRRESTEQVTLQIDGQNVTVPKGTSIMRAAMDGGTQIPKLARSLGQAQKEFKQGLKEGAVEDAPTDEA